ncbi:MULTISPECIES: hypothetical protein [unclassified Pseudoalteromonas]|uniref:hypothetical protein n=1 Tax=unclassified Pseudoalteromonas TaxID=194690 RepID=UPI000CF722D4|nr:MULTISPECIES: hypothetical protein [unclassified Pseudoalteromonas]
MRIYRSFHRAPLRVLMISRRRQKLKLRRAMVTLKWALAQERQETREMLDIYKRYTKGQASKQDLQVANKQFVDILKGLGLGVFAVLPFAPITIPLVVKIAHMVGVDILPSSFSHPKPPKTKADNKPKDD